MAMAAVGQVLAREPSARDWARYLWRRWCHWCNAIAPTSWELEPAARGTATVSARLC